MTYQDAMTAGKQAAAHGDYQQALRHFAKAHALGHNIRRHHLAAHAAMIAISWPKHPLRALTQLGLWAAAYLFDRPPATVETD